MRNTTIDLKQEITKRKLLFCLWVIGVIIHMSTVRWMTEKIYSIYTNYVS